MMQTLSQNKESKLKNFLYTAWLNSIIIPCILLLCPLLKLMDFNFIFIGLALFIYTIKAHHNYLKAKVHKGCYIPFGLYYSWNMICLPIAFSFNFDPEGVTIFILSFISLIILFSTIISFFLSARYIKIAYNRKIHTQNEVEAM